MNKIAFVLLASLGLTGCATRTQTVGTTAGAVGGALIGGPVGACRAALKCETPDSMFSMA